MTMARFYFILFLVMFWKSSLSSQSNETDSEIPLDVSITSEDDSDQELSSQLHEVDNRAGGWSSWSTWSGCSRSCDGGVAHQVRSCKIGLCRGDHIRYKICNMQAVVAFFAVLAAVNAGLLAPSANILQGPSTRTTVVGPDGSAISAVAPGGQVITEQHAGLVAHAAPALAYSAPALAYSAPALSYSAPLAYAAAPVGVVGHHGLNTVVAGPSGTIATTRGLVAPGYLGHGLYY